MSSVEMQWERRKLILSDRVCVIIECVSKITAIFSNI